MAQNGLWIPSNPGPRHRLPQGDGCNPGKESRLWLRFASCLCLSIGLSGCGGGSGGGRDEVPSPLHSVGVTVTGLVGSGLQLRNGADTLAVESNGPATFATKLPGGARYSVTVLSQPAVPAQTCEVESGEGTIAGGDVTDVVVRCVTSTATRFAYAVNHVDGSISIYNVDAASGQLRMRGYAKAGTGPVAAAHDPAGRFTYVLNSGVDADPEIQLQHASISVFEHDNVSGDLREIDGSPFTTSLGFSPRVFLTLHPSGDFLYVTNDEGTIFQWAVAADGTLTPVTDEPVVTAGSSPGPLLFDPAGRFAYLTHSGYRGHAKGIDVYELDPTTGALQEREALRRQFADGDLRTAAYAFHPGGRLLTVVYQQFEEAQAHLAALVVDAATGALTPVAREPLVLPRNPVSAPVFAGGGRFAYLSCLADPTGPGALAGISIDDATGELSPLALSPYATGALPGRPALTPSGELLYVASRGSRDAGDPSGPGVISAFRIDPVSGALTRLLDTETAAPGPSIAHVDPSGRYLYASSNESDRTHAYRIVASGGLTPLAQGAVLRAGHGPISIDTFVSPTIATPAVFASRFAYLSHAEASAISSYKIDAGAGVLEPEGIVASNTIPHALAPSPDGRFLYVTEATNRITGSGSLSTYSIDSATGALAAGGAGTVPTAAGALDVAVDPSNRFVYVANNVDGTVTPYERDVDTGGLAPNGGAVRTIAGPFRLAIDPTGRNLYVMNTGQLQTFSIDPRTGRLRAGAIAGIGRPDSAVLATNLAVDPGGRFLYVLNVDGSVETFPIDAPSGALGAARTLEVARGYAVLALEPTGRFLYTGSHLSLERSIQVYSIAQDTGEPTVVGSANLPEDPRRLAVDSSGKHLYAELFDGSIVTLAIDPDTGALTTVASSAGVAPASDTPGFVTVGAVQ